jgi:glycosyltransferase involved in cell wall biosynthesis
MTAKVCIIATIKAPLRETICFVNYHLNLGIDGIILFLDDPQDPAAEALSDYIRVHAIKCDNAYWTSRRIEVPATSVLRQTLNVNYGIKLAGKIGFDWAIYIDGDELLMPDGDIKSILAQQTVDVVRFAMKEAVSEKDRYENIFEATLFKERVTTENRSRLELAYSMARDGAFFEGEYLRGHSDSKVAVRINSNIEWMSSHGPVRPKMAEVGTARITLLHYDCVGIDAWKRKWINRLNQPGVETSVRPNRLKQFELFKKAYGNAAEELALFSRLHKISDHDKRVLVQYGLLTVITLPHETFERPKRRVQPVA